MEALFFNFSKKRNSTAVPEDSSGTSMYLYLKQDTSLRQPTFVISANLFGYNYCKFGGRYYFVTDVISHKNDLWYVNCEIDDLATLRSQILASNAYVLYDKTGNANIVDGRLAVSTAPSVQSSAVAFPGVDTTIGRYVLSCVGVNSCAAWAIPYRMNPAALIGSIYNQSVEDLIDTEAGTWSDDSTDTTTAIQKFAELLDKWFSWTVDFQKKSWKQNLASGDALSAIRSCVWLPFDFSTDSTDAGLISLGNFETGFAGIKLGTPANPSIKTLSTATINIPWQASDFRRNDQYTKLYLYIPFIGVIPLSASSLIGASSISVTPALNVISGDLAVRVSCGSQTIGTYGANVAVPIQLGASAATPKQVITTFLSSVTAAGAAAISGSAAAFGTAALSGFVANSLAGITGHPASVGGISSGAGSGLLTNIVLFSVFHNTVVEPASVAPVMGRPACAVKTLSSCLGGYLQTSEFSLQAEAESTALEAVNAALNGGIFLE